MPEPSPDPIQYAATQAMIHPTESVETLRAARDAAPDDLLARASYFGALARSSGGMQLSPAVIDEFLWWIAEHPERIVDLRTATGRLTHAPFDVYVRIRDAWEPALLAHATNPVVLRGAAYLFQHHEPARALELLERAHALDTSDAHAAMEAGQIHKLAWIRRRHSEVDAGAADSARESLRWFERALERAHDEASRTVLVGLIAEAALACGRQDDASLRAREMLRAAESEAPSWNTGNQVYEANAILGRVALARGDRRVALEHLTAAGRTPGSPQLNSFGPELELADALLKIGERAAVVAFLRDIQRFWKSGRDRIDVWCAQIDRGETPRLDRFGSR